MKIKRLFLQAFGPFTDKTIDFTGSGDGRAANLHLIYGPNEAGKSSALRAMTDLRFDIPLRSQDSFIHANSKLRIAGEFENAKGETVSLVRRKGRGSTLALFDPATGEAIDAGDVSREHQLALTDGMERAEFEAMFGLDHQRLRAGGKLLLNGEGELGSALFEASAGTRGISEILAGLETESKKYFSPRASTAVMNAAKKELEEQRRIWKQSLTRPADWQSLNRAHEQAKATLTQLGRDLEVMRRKENELTELRTVAPLLKEYDQAVAQRALLADAPDLPDGARERRLAAEQAIVHARQDVDKAERGLERCTDELGRLTIEPLLLEHAEAIERLAAAIEPVQRSAIDLLQQQAAIEHAEAHLQVLAGRIASDLSIDAIVAAMPSDAETLELSEHLEAISRLTQSHADLIERIERLDRIEAAQANSSATIISPEARQSLQAALHHARSQGDISQAVADLERELLAIEIKRNRALSGLNIASDTQLRVMRPLMESRLVEAGNEFAAVNKAIRRIEDEDRLLAVDLDEQRLEQRKLEAEGELVTADTLLHARQHRDEGWALVRNIYIEQLQCTDELVSAFAPDLPLPEAFEVSLHTADHQADLLRADAERAARFAVSATRIEAMLKRRHAIVEEREALQAQLAQLQQAWEQELTGAQLPLLPPETLHEWQLGRLSALDISDRQAELQAEHGRKRAGEEQARATLIDALQGVGQPLVQAATLASLIEQAAQWEKRATESDAERSALAKASRERQVEHNTLVVQRQQIETSLQKHRLAVRDSCSRLFLPTDSAHQVVKARLAEIEKIARDARSLADMILRQQQSQAVMDNFERQARELATLLAEPIPAIATDFTARLRKRLAVASDQEQQRVALEREQAQLRAAQLQAEAERKNHQATLKQLCLSAAVARVEQLPEQEQRAAQKRQATLDVDTQHNRLMHASLRPEDELREKLREQDTVAIDAERERCRLDIDRLEQEQAAARSAEEVARRALEQIDSSDTAAAAREAMESAAATCRSAIRPWARLKIAHALLQQAMKRFKDRAQAPMVASASNYFSLMTAGRYVTLLADESGETPVLMAERDDGVAIHVEAMSEGTADQLYLALRLASLELRRSSHVRMPLILDDVLITSDDERSANMLKALAAFSEGGQVMLFTHHRHLVDLARDTLSSDKVALHDL